MFKKVISVIIMFLMIISTLTGCGVNDLGYLNLSKEQSKTSEYSFKNNSTIIISETLSGERYNIDFELEGVANLTNLDSMYMSFDLLLKVNDIEIKNPVDFKLVDNKFYVNKDVLLEIIKLSKIMEDSTKGIEKVIKSLYDNDLKDVEYILLADLGDIYVNTDTEEITDIVMNYLEVAFKGFDSKIIRKTSKGYSLELNSENLLDFLKNVSEYLNKNKELVFDETVKYIENLLNIMDLDSFVKAAYDEEDNDEYNLDESNVSNQEYIDETINELKENKQEFFDFIDEFAVMLKTEETKTYIEMIKGSKFKQELSKSRNTYNVLSDIVVVYEGEEMLQFTSNTTIIPKKVNITNITAKTLELEDLQEMYKVVENRINPVEKIEVSWYDDDFYADINSVRSEGNSNYDYKDFIIKEGRIYLPLRYICETFGEEVEWDNVNRKAYILRVNQRIDMTGLIKDGSTMVKVRDFEKLGYKVDYEKVEDVSVATIIKP